MEQIQTTITSTAHIETPLGSMIAYASRNGICLLAFDDLKNIANQMASLSSLAIMDIGNESNPHIDLLREELVAYFDGSLTRFSVSLDFIGTDFQKKVWNQLLTIPYGSTVSYLQQARAMGVESAVRAVANANGANKIGIVVPCHRVIGTNKTLTGYAGGLERKRYLLDLESPNKGLFG